MAEISFEEAFSRLETTVRRLEEEELSLAEMVAVYEEAVALSGLCSRLLDQAELRVTQVIADAQGGSETVPFEVRGAVPSPGEG